MAAYAEQSRSHACRRSISRNPPLPTQPYPASCPLEEHKLLEATTGLPALASSEPVPVIIGNPFPTPSMSLSRSPSPRRGGGWSTPGLGDDSDHGTPRRRDYGNLNGSTPNDTAWAAAKAKSTQIQNTPSFTTRNEGFFSRQKRKISATLPRFNSFNSNRKDWNAEKLGRGRWRPAGSGKWSSLKTLVGNILRKFKVLIVMIIFMILGTVLWSKSSTCFRSQWGNAGS